MSKERIVGRAHGLWSEFQSFAIKGNALELAVAVVVGAAFSGIVNSLVADIVTPLLGFITGNVDLKTLSYMAAPNLVIRYGAFLQAILNFFIISVSIFLVFKSFSSARKRLFKEGEQAVPEYEKPAQERLLEEIRDLLRDRK